MKKLLLILTIFYSSIQISFSNDLYNDNDGDSLDDHWERLNFCDLDQIGTDNNDNDEFNNLQEFNMDLDPTNISSQFTSGWNLLSVANVPQDNTIINVFGNLVSGKVWCWENGLFQSATEINPLKGYWVFSNTPNISSATYKVTFNGLWSEETHPGNSYTASAHFSALVGGTHNQSVKFWVPGGIASLGIEDMAERGLTGNLISEFNSEITNGNAYNTITGGSINSPGTVSTTFDIQKDFPFVTLVTMVAPSPDWFVGVSAMNLTDNNNWIDHKTVCLFAYDAGTENGSNFSLNNSETNPKQPISLIQEPPFDLSTNNTPLGTFTFERQ